MNSPDIVFPNIGLEFDNIDPVAFTLFGKEVYWYGIIIVTGMISGLLLARYRAKKNGEDPEIYSDFIIYALIGAIIGARLYYVAFEWESYKDNLIEIFNTRNGGLAVYGGVLGAVIVVLVYTRIKHLDFWQIADTAAPGIPLGQAIGRWGNFINKEAFGGPTDSTFAMALKASEAKIPSSMVQYITSLDGYDGNYLIVQPTFLYESVWNILLVVFLIYYTKHKKFKGELLVLYFVIYGVGRAWIEGLRTDQLLIGSSNIPVSQALAVVMILIGGGFILYKRHKAKDISEA